MRFGREPRPYAFEMAKLLLDKGPHVCRYLIFPFRIQIQIHNVQITVNVYHPLKIVEQDGVSVQDGRDAFDLASKPFAKGGLVTCDVPPEAISLTHLFGSVMIIVVTETNEQVRFRGFGDDLYYQVIRITAVDVCPVHVHRWCTLRFTSWLNDKAVQKVCPCFFVCYPIPPLSHESSSCGRSHGRRRHDRYETRRSVRIQMPGTKVLFQLVRQVVCFHHGGPLTRSGHQVPDRRI